MTMPDNESPRLPEPESEEFRKFKAAMLKIVSVRKENIVGKLPKGFQPGKETPDKKAQGRP